MEKHQDPKLGQGKTDHLSIYDNLGQKLELFDLYNTIVPIFLYSNKHRRLVGTGFMLTRNLGLLVTAGHVLETILDKHGNIQPGKGLQIMQFHNKKRFDRRIYCFNSINKLDVGLAMCELLENPDTKREHENRVFPLSGSLAKENDNVVTLSFPDSDWHEVKNGIQQISLSLNPYPGQITKIHSKDTDDEYVRKKFGGICPIYQTSMQVHHGASGGPVMSNGKLIGFNSSGWDYVEGEESISYVIPIQALMDLKPEEAALTVRQLIERTFISIS